MEPIGNKEEKFWLAVQVRDAAQDGQFVYAVRSTGIYCKPSCPSRRPRREQVAFYPNPEAAEAAGFRACKRCNPRQAAPPAELVQRACGWIAAHIEQPFSLEELAAEMQLSSQVLRRLFHSELGLTPRRYAEGLRLEKFKAHIKNGQDVTGALYEAGYSSSSRLYEHSDRKLGMTPAAYRRGGHGMEIHYTVVDTPLGRMLVAGTARGVCAVSFGEEDTDLEAFLRSEYPAARRTRDDSSLGEWARALVEHLAGSRPQPGLPLDVQATAFQLRVWEELRRIPYGQTRSYTEVAQAIGEPQAVRAVANACAANPAVLVTPCHRVVRSDGGLGGYRWGMERKQALLEREKEGSK
jgi:AraC family transcriptional regulator, regulatory protein of adaptative response / methylated-DNA-[protein]-cysteine methyltransferase